MKLKDVPVGSRIRFPHLDPCPEGKTNFYEEYKVRWHESCGKDTFCLSLPKRLPNFIDSIKEVEILVNGEWEK